MTTYQIFQRADGIQYACQNDTAVYYRPHRCASWVRTSVVIDFDFFSLVGEAEVTDVSEEAPVFNGQNASDVSFYFQAMRNAEYATPSEAAHADALAMNDAFDIRGVNLARRYRQFFAANDYHARREIVEAAHDDALAMNASIDAKNDPRTEGTGYARGEWPQHVLDAAHAQALEEDDRFDGIIRDSLTPEQRVIQSRREKMDIYGDGFPLKVQQDHDEALAMNAALDVEYASIDRHVPTEAARPRFKSVAAHFIVGAPRTF